MPTEFKCKHAITSEQTCDDFPKPPMGPPATLYHVIAVAGPRRLAGGKIGERRGVVERGEVL
jgi:hypothetical protein